MSPARGYSPAHIHNWADAPFTRFRTASGGHVGTAGLALQEIQFLDDLGPVIAPRRGLVIGNALGQIFPEARIVGLDPEQSGNDLLTRTPSGMNAVFRD